MAATSEQERTQLQQYRHSRKDKRTGTKEEMRMAPLISLAVRHAVDGPASPQPLFAQYGLLGFDTDNLNDNNEPEPIFFHVDAPNSAFICGSQGSGKSYTMACMLESCLLADKKGELINPVAGLAFHFDNDSPDVVAEVASLRSRGIKLKVLVSPSNVRARKQAYAKLTDAEKHLTVEPLLFRDEHLDADNMRKLIAFSEQEGSVPLYMEVIEQKLRELKIADRKLSFTSFRHDLEAVKFAPQQQNMMNMRLDLLGSFMSNNNKKKKNKCGNQKLFQLDPGTVTIVDLSDTFVDAATACTLFDVCLSLAEKLRPVSGLVVSLDEAHKFLNKSSAAMAFTERLLAAIRTQRHIVTRMLIATQEPTISEKLLDLCSVTIVHHFKSPAWFAALKGHLGGASSLTASETEQNEMFREIVELATGESLVFAPGAFVREEGGQPKKLGTGVLRMQTRMREGLDIGKSQMASEGT